MQRKIYENNQLSLNDKSILITGGTGSFGMKCVEEILKKYNPRRLIIFSRDELKQFEMANVFSPNDYPCLRYFIGDVRDKNRLYRALQDVDVAIHAAALKQIPAAEYNPFEAIKTNIMGAENLISACLDAGVKKVIAMSTDKSVSPVNLYGATKLCSDKLFVTANVYKGHEQTKFSVVRYGNVVGSRGSVIPLFLKMKDSGTLTITDPRMTRFWITREQGVRFVMDSLASMIGGEIFVPKLPSMNIMDLAKAIGPNCKTEIIGVRPGEKIHETMIPVGEGPNTLEFDDRFVVLPMVPHLRRRFDDLLKGANFLDEYFEYSSGSNEHWLSAEQLQDMVNDL